MTPDQALEGEARSMSNGQRIIEGLTEAVAHASASDGNERIDDPDEAYINAALSWYAGGPAGDDVDAAWKRIRSRLSDRVCPDGWHWVMQPKTEEFGGGCGVSFSATC